MSDPALHDNVFHLENVRITREASNARFELCVEHLEVARGELLALIGPSGCGKSTLLDLLSMVSRPQHVGRYAFAPAPGRVVDVGALLAGGRGDGLAALRRDGIGYVLQTGGLLPFLSVRRNIGLSRALAGDAAEPVVSEVAAALGVAEHLAKLPASLSVGERQRVAIARALAHRPAVVLADEPTAALDPANAGRVMASFVALARMFGATVIVASHDRERVAALGFRCLSPVLAGDGAAVTARFDSS